MCVCVCVCRGVSRFSNDVFVATCGTGNRHVSACGCRNRVLHSLYSEKRGEVADYTSRGVMYRLGSVLALPGSAKQQCALSHSLQSGPSVQSEQPASIRAHASFFATEKFSSSAPATRKGKSLSSRRFLLYTIFFFFIQLDTIGECFSNIRRRIRHVF